MQSEQAKRDSVIVRTSIIGIIANLFLAGFKAAVGLISGSIAVVLDAVNNLSDALSSVITIVGTKLASKKPDKKHPLGYGRIEYLTAMIVAAIVLYAGITSLVESIKKIASPELPDYSVVSLIIIAAAVVVKLLLGRYVKSVGEKVNSGSLVASGSDALSDAILSASVLASALIYFFTKISLEAFVGVVISVFIIRAGLEMLTDTLDEILGKRVEGEEIKAIKKTICADPDVHGAYDLILHSYGPEKLVGSVHVEIDDSLSANEIDAMERRLAHDVFAEHGVLLTGVGIYAINNTDDEVVQLRRDVYRIVTSHDGVLQVHGFYADTEKKDVTFDVIIDFDLRDRRALYTHILGDLNEAYPDYTFHVQLDLDV